MIISASEDIGMADNNALSIAVAGASAVALIGMPEAGITLGHVATYLALAPKSNAAYVAITEALSDVENGLGRAVPAHLRDAHSGALRDELESVDRASNEYLYSHDYPEGIVSQNYLPKELLRTKYYRPTQHGAAARTTERLEKINKILERKDDNA